MHSPAAGASFLLLGRDNSSTCLNCHQHAGDTGPSSYHISTAEGDMPAGTAPLQRTPGGDYGWIKKDFTYTYTSNNVPVTETEFGRARGHNIVAVDYSYVADSVNTLAPGGSYPASQLGCTSCHDPHSQNRRTTENTATYVRPAIGTAVPPIRGSGSYSNSVAPDATAAVGVYRLLAGIGYAGAGTSFAVNPPTAVAPSSYNAREDTTQNRVAYGQGASTWCATCHSGMHTTGGNLTHPVDQNLGTGIANNYNAYRRSGDLTGTAATAYLTLVPFEENIGDFAQLKTHTGNYLQGPASTAQVSCMSCHRAHASGWLHALRFDIGYEFTTVNGLYVASNNGSVSGSRAPLQHRGKTEAEVQAAYYDRPASTFATFQRVLCNKCHAKD